jgi:carboxylesterase type B
MFGVDSPKFTYTLQAQYDSVVNQTGCSSAADTLQCLRTVPINDLYAAEDNLTSIGPVIDGDFIRREPVLELDAGNVHRVPIMVGANADEGLFVVTLIGSPNTTAEIRPLLSAILPALSNDTLDAVLAAYPQDAPAPPYSLAAEYPWCAAMEAANLTCTPEYRRTAAILGDWFADAGRRYMARKWSELGLPTYSFRFAADPTGIPIRYWTNLGPGFAEHGVDLAYGFRLPGGFTTPIDYYPPVKKVHSHEYLSRVIASKVVSFAHSLDPNSYDSKSPFLISLQFPMLMNTVPHAPSWPQYASSSPRNYLYNASVEEVDIHIEADTYREDGIEIWLSHILQAYYNEDAPHTGSLG